MGSKLGGRERREGRRGRDAEGFFWAPLAIPGPCWLQTRVGLSSSWRGAWEAFVLLSAPLGSPSPYGSHGDLLRDGAVLPEASGGQCVPRDDRGPVCSEAVPNVPLLCDRVVEESQPRGEACPSQGPAVPKARSSPACGASRAEMPLCPALFPDHQRDRTRARAELGARDAQCARALAPQEAGLVEAPATARQDRVTCVQVLSAPWVLYLWELFPRQLHAVGLFHQWEIEAEKD